MKRLFKNSTRGVFSLLMLGAILFFGALRNADAQVAVDSSSNTAAFNEIRVAGLTWSHTVGSGADRALFVGVSTSATTAGLALARVDTITYGSQSLTPVTNGFRASPDANNAVELFVLVAPTSGMNTITVTMRPTATTNYAVGGSVSFTEVNQFIPTGNFVSAANALGVPSNTATVSVSDSDEDDLVLDVIGTSFNAQNLTPSAAQFRQWRQLDSTPNPPPPFYVGAGSVKLGASGSVTMSWNLPVAQNWAIGAIAVKAALPATASDVTISGRATTASGKSVSRAFITMTDTNGNTRRTMTNPFGFYRFKEVPSGATYIFEARSKTRTFSPRILSVTEETSELNFVANP